ncbi:MAG: M20 family metallopeptidase [Erysipelotrichia bacterium]|jgi:succinyl-diaminopimelate desuccinylase|nr:M20 family metallopeptidase [Erysipelotrichia bacterium]
MKQDLDYIELTNPYRKNAIRALQEMIKINSVYDEKTISNLSPYGSGVDQALKYIGRLARQFGFEVDYCDNRLTEMTFGKGEKLISVFAHADIVPIGNNWKHKPLDGEIEKGKMYGRGTSDDKGPLIAAFYAIKALKDNDLINNYRVRLVVGGDEERGSSCLKYYFSQLKKEHPTYGFTPDASFPVVYGEKGISNFKAKLNIVLPSIMKISGGEAVNSVIDSTTIVMKTDAGFEKYVQCLKNKAIIEQGNGISKVIFQGKSAHGSTPQAGLNAGIMALEALGTFYQNDILLKIVAQFKDFNGKPFRGFAHSKDLGETTYNVGVLNYDGKVLELKVNFRYPEKVNDNDFVKKFEEASGLSTEIYARSPVLLFPLKSKLIKILLDAYRIESCDKRTKPMTMGGGTYAKEAPNTVAFGAAFPDDNPHMHEADEYIILNNFYLAMAIYARAIHVLGNSK